MWYAGTSIRRSVSGKPCIKWVWCKRTFSLLPKSAKASISSLVSLCPTGVFIFSSYWKGAGNGRARKIFPPGSFSHMDHSDILHKCSITLDEKKNKLLHLFIYLIPRDGSEPCEKKQLYCGQWSAAQRYRAKESWPSAPVRATSQSKTPTTDRRFPRSSLA